MKVLFLLYGTLVIGVMSGTAQQEDKSLSSGNAALLWKISGNGLARPSYLFGTIHLICPEDYVWTSAMQRAFEACETVAFELDMDDPALQQAVSQGMQLPEGKQLQDFFTPEEYEKLAAFFETQLGIPLQSFQHQQPFALLSILSMKAIDCPLPDSYEGRLAEMAAAGGKPVVGLETAADQLSVLNELDQEATAGQLLRVVEDWEALQRQYAGMVQQYRHQDLPALYESIITAPDFKDHLNTLLFDRNKKWIPEIDSLLRRQRVFIAVGAGHLWGDKGIIALLRDQGYTLEPVH